MRSSVNDLLIAEFWVAVRTRLDTPTMVGFTGASGRVYRAGVDQIPTEEAAAGDWKRLVVVPAQTLWPQIDAPGEPRGIAWLVRAEANAWNAPGYDPSIGLERMQQEAYRQLDTWIPAAFTNVRVMLPIYRVSPPQSVPLRDDDRGIWFTTSQFRADVAGVVAA